MPEPQPQAADAQHQELLTRRLRELQPDAIVCGLGTSLQLLLQIGLPATARIWGVNDIWQHTPVHDLVVVDTPIGEHRVSKGQPGFTWVAAAKPDNTWVYESKLSAWQDALPDRELRSFHPRSFRARYPPPLPSGLRAPIPTCKMSPSAAVGLAWACGARRIGVIGVDLLDERHSWSCQARREMAQDFFVRLNDQAADENGRIANLSPWTAVPFGWP